MCLSLIAEFLRFVQNTEGVLVKPAFVNYPVTEPCKGFCYYHE